MDDLLARLDRRQLVLIAGSVVVLLATLIITYVLMPDFKEFREQKKSLQVLENATGEGTDLPNQIKSLEQSVLDLEKRLHGDMGELPIQQMEAYIVGRLQSISWEEDVELVSVEPGAGTKSEEFVEVLFKVELVGGYFDLYAWVQGVTNDLGFVVIKEYEMRPLGDDSDEPQLSVTLTMASYRAGDV